MKVPMIRKQMRLTRAEKDALISAANHMLAGGSSDARDALGLDTEEEGTDLLELLESAVEKLSP